MGAAAQGRSRKAGPPPAGCTKALGCCCWSWGSTLREARSQGPSVCPRVQTDVWAPREENTALPRRRPPRSRPQGLTKCGEQHVKKHISVKCPKIFQRRERFQGRKRNLNEHRQNVDQISMLWIWAIGPSLRDNEQTAASLGNQELGGRPGQGPEDIWPSGSSGCPPRETAGESDPRRHVHTQPAGGFICETSLDLPTPVPGNIFTTRLPKDNFPRGSTF